MSGISSPARDCILLIEALAKIRDESWCLTVAGSQEFDPHYSRSMQELARRDLPVEKISFTGRVSDKALRNLYLQHDLLVVPSEYEGFGIVYLEAMNMGLVPIGSTDGGAGEIITNSKDGFLINPNDAEGLAEILQELIRDPKKIRSLIMNARKRAGSFYSWHENAKSIRNFLVELLRSDSKVQSS
ncbi:MAG: glycosyltransferase family 4 protein [Anaerolineaceae bacterium]